MSFINCLNYVCCLNRLLIVGFNLLSATASICSNFLKCQETPDLDFLQTLLPEVIYKLMSLRTILNYLMHKISQWISFFVLVFYFLLVFLTSTTTNSVIITIIILNLASQILSVEIAYVGYSYIYTILYCKLLPATVLKKASW